MVLLHMCDILTLDWSAQWRLWHCCREGKNFLPAQFAVQEPMKHISFASPIVLEITLSLQPAWRSIE